MPRTPKNPQNVSSNTAPVARLVEVMRRLRNPEGGCPWDLEQNFKTIAPHTLEETYEVIEAIEQDDPKAMADELGDLLFQIVFHAQMGSEAGLFDLDAIATHVADKMIERHPHVFGDPPALQSSSGGQAAMTAHKVVVNWESDKAAKREAQAKAENRTASALDGISTALPAILRALKLQNRAARVGFDWTEAKDILAKIREEIGELETEINADAGKDSIEDELGDLFFALVNLARRLEIDPEGALRRTNRKFERRFREVERRVEAEGRTMKDTPLDDMEAKWTAIKREEKRLKKTG